MTPLIVVTVSCLILGFGHIGWGIIHPVKAMRDSGIDQVVPASFHACWYHVSLIFFATAGLIIWHLAVASVNPDLFVLLGFLIFGCWLTYLGTLLFYPMLWRIAWFQMGLIPFLLANLAYAIYQ
mgnify:FL=1